MKGRKANNKNKKTYLLIAFLVISSFIFTNNNKTINKINTTTKALDQEGQNYRLVTSADNVQVPVPKGYVASQVTGENYVTPQYQHTTITQKISSTPTVLTWSSPEGEQYPWTQDENGIWISGNQGIPNSESVLESEEFDYVKGSTLTINYTYSNLYGDYLNIDLINLTTNIKQRIADKKNGNFDDSFHYTTSNYTWTMNDGGTGRYKIRAIYSKDGATNMGQDSGYIKTSTYFKEDENGETIEIDQKTKVHDGGLVIYQLTDEETEIDPNGTGVVINDTNKDTAQTTRNQYVWVPVPNIEDITRTKTTNNGIIQFGQEYLFSDTSITKETDIRSDYFREPRFLENQDKTCYYLQKNSNVNKREDYLNKMQEDFIRMIKSINKYKGFYIGRYETGDEISHNSTKGCFTIPKVIRYNGRTNYVSWYNSNKDLERLSGKTGEYVETGMLYDSLFDYTLKWLNETDFETSIDSGKWGNYYNNILRYKLSADGEEIKRIGNEYLKVPTGSITKIIFNGETYSDYPTSSNNIFDIAGNLYELTRSRYNNGNRRLRGGYFGQNSYKNQMTIKDGYNPNASVDFVGVRSQLYIL